MRGTSRQSSLGSSSWAGHFPTAQCQSTYCPKGAPHPVLRTILSPLARGEGSHKSSARKKTSIGSWPYSLFALLKLPIRPVQLDHRMLRRHLESDQQLTRQHVAILLIVGKLDAGRDTHPAIDIAVEDRRLPLLITHMDVLEPVEILPAHELHIALEERAQ